MTLKIRLYFSDKIQSDLVSHLTKEQSHYVKDVMRLEKGDYLSVFNAQGEWNAIIENYEKEGARIKILKKVRDRDNEKNIWLAFSPIKQNPLNFMIQKATELGVQKLIPLICERSIVKNINTTRIKKIKKLYFLSCAIIHEYGWTYFYYVIKHIKFLSLTSDSCITFVSSVLIV